MTTLYETLQTRILGQFSGSPNILALFEAIYTEIQTANDLLEDLRDNRDVETAEGVWLDILGDIVGVTRPYKEEEPGNIFTFRSLGGSSDPNMGFLNVTTGGYMQSHEGIASITDPGLETDENYRRIIKAKIQANNAGGTIPDLFTHILSGFECWTSIESPETGLVTITLEGWLSKRERYYIEDQGPVHAGIAIEFLNWEISE